MNPDELTDAEQRLLLHMRAMGHLKTPLVRQEHEVMGDLVRFELAERTGSGAQERYVFTVLGAQVAEQLANK